jgi:hypothetical protein
MTAHMGAVAIVESVLPRGGQMTITEWRVCVRRVMCVGASLALLISACGGGEMTMTEYVDSLNVIVEQARQQYETLAASTESGVLVAEPDQLSEFTPQDLQAALVHVRQIEAVVDEATSAIDPPEQVAELHNLFFDFDSEFIFAQEALAVRAGTAVDWNELSNTPEMAAYRMALAQDKQSCIDAQAHVNAIGEQREAFAETQWIPAELREIFEVALGCDGYPEHPEDVYRPPATPIP